MPLERKQINITDNLDFFARQVVEGFLTGLHKSPYHGFSVEFAEHRLYNPGESTKNIDWKLFARSDKLFVKKFEDETNLRSHILIDTSSSMQYPMSLSHDESKLTFSLYAAACLIHLFHKQRDGFGLTLYNEVIDFFAPARSNKVHYNHLISKLDSMLSFSKQKKNKKTNFQAVISDFIEKIPKRSLVIIFSDMFNFDDKQPDQWLEALQHLRYRKNEVILFHVQDSSEKLLDLPNQPYEFVDLENNNSIKLNPSTHRENYKKLYSEFEKKLELYCGQYSIDYVPAFIQQGFNKILVSYLTKRSKLF